MVRCWCWDGVATGIPPFGAVAANCTVFRGFSGWVLILGSRSESARLWCLHGEYAATLEAALGALEAVHVGVCRWSSRVWRRTRWRSCVRSCSHLAGRSRPACRTPPTSSPRASSAPSSSSSPSLSSSTSSVLPSLFNTRVACCVYKVGRIRRSKIGPVCVNVSSFENFSSHLKSLRTQPQSYLLLIIWSQFAAKFSILWLILRKLRY